jgi:hypothetical protein
MKFRVSQRCGDSLTSSTFREGLLHAVILASGDFPLPLSWPSMGIIDLQSSYLFAICSRTSQGLRHTTTLSLELEIPFITVMVFECSNPGIASLMPVCRRYSALCCSVC